MNPSAEIVTNVKKYISDFNGIKESHVSIQKSKSRTWHVRDILLIRIWVNQEVFDANSIMAILSDENTFEDEISTICRGAVVPQYDIYYV